MYSALKVNGQKLYDLARQGKTVERKPRAITVYELELLEQSAPDEFALRVVCSKGTYIRTLCHDLGQALGCGGCMAALRRTMAAGFRIKEAVTLERAQEEREALLLPLDEYFRAYPRFTVQNETQEKRAYNGNASPRAALRMGNTAFTTARGTSSRSPARRAASCTPSRISFEENRP